MSGLINRIDRFIDTDKKETGEITLDQHKDELLIFLMEKGISFPSEISRHLSISMDGINQIISHWKKLGFVENIIPNPDMPQAEFDGRIREMWAKGIIGYGAISSRSWWTITLGGIEYIKIKYKGKHLPIKGSLVKKYKLEID